MPSDLLGVINPFLTAGIATFVLLYYFVHPKHKLKTEQILIFWFLAGAVFFFIPYIPKSVSIPFAYFLVQAGLIYILLKNYWKIGKKDLLPFTAVYLVVNIVSILALGFVFKDIV